jgi:hypothetical protein
LKVQYIPGWVGVGLLKLQLGRYGNGLYEYLMKSNLCTGIIFT